MGLRGQKTRVILVQLSLRGELLVPVFGPLPCDQTMLGCDQARVTRGSLACVTGSLPTPLPEPVSRLSLLLQARRGFQRARQRGRFEGFEHPLGDERLDRRTCDIWAIGATIRAHRTATDRTMRRAWPAVTPLQTGVAPATDRSAAQQRWAATSRASRVGVRAIGGQARHVPFVLLPRDRGGNRVLEPHMLRVGRTRHTTTPGLARPCSAPIDLAAPIGVGSRIDRIAQERLPGRPFGTAPRQRPLGRPCAQAPPELDTVPGKRAHEGMQRAEFVARAKHEMHDLVHLGIGSHRNGPRRISDIADRQAKAPLSTARFMAFALIHTLCDPRQFRLTHSTLQSQ